MSVLRLLRERLRTILGGGREDKPGAEWETRASAEIEAELADHVERRTASLVSRGMPREEARAEARRRLGDARRIEEELMRLAERRHRRGVLLGVLEDARLDAVVGLRAIARNRLFAGIVIVTVALGVGAVTSIFGLVNAVLFRPLPYQEPERVVRLYNRWSGTPDAGLSPAEYLDYEDGTTSVFSAIGAWAMGSLNVTGAGDPERVNATFVSAGGFDAAGVEPVLGRTFTAEEESANAALVLLSHAIWQRRFGGAPDVVGRSLVLSGRQFTVLGVFPRGFGMPGEFQPGSRSDLYVPLGLDRSQVTARRSHYLDGLAKLRPGVSRERGEAELVAVADRFVAAFPDDYPRDMRFGVYAVPVADDVLGSVRGVLFVFLGAVSFVLLIAAANVSALMLTRAESRRRELAVRAALGAGRARLARMQLMESLQLALVGCALAVLLAVGFTRAIVAWQPPGLPRLDAVPVDATVLIFAIAVSLLTGLLFGVAPSMTGGASFAAMREGGERGNSSRRGSRFRRGLIVLELALALVLLTGAGLLFRTMDSLLDTDPGFDPAGVLTTRISLSEAEYGTDAERRLFWSEFVQRVSQLPGAEAAGAVTNLPLATSLGDINIQIEGREILEGDVSPALDWQVVTPGYFETVGMHVLGGRGIAATDGPDAAGVVVLNASAAELHFPDGAIGQRFVLGGEAGPGMVTVIGIVNDIRHGGLGEPARPEMYLAHEQFRFWNGGSAVTSMNLVVRVRGEPASHASAVRSVLAALDPEQPAGTFQTLEQVVADSLSRPRFALLLLGVFAGLALLLSAVGTYGVIAYATSRRTREMGVRMALGARRAQVMRLVLGQGLRLAALGIGAGVIGALALTRLLQGLLYGVAPGDPATLLGVSIVLGAVTVLACALPAHRATRVHPASALRPE